MKLSFSMHEPWRKVCTLKGCRKETLPKAINVSLIHILMGNPVNPKKIVDLQKMILFLPPSWRDFYSTLADHPVSSNSDDD